MILTPRQQAIEAILIHGQDQPFVEVARRIDALFTPQVTVGDSTLPADASVEDIVAAFRAAGGAS